VKEMRLRWRGAMESFDYVILGAGLDGLSAAASN
jgi:monoamine oxidase